MIAVSLRKLENTGVKHSQGCKHVVNKVIGVVEILRVLEGGTTTGNPVRRVAE